MKGSSQARLMFFIWLCLTLAGVNACTNKEKKEHTHYDVELNIDVASQQITSRITIQHKITQKEIDSLVFLVHDNMNFSTKLAQGFATVREHDLKDSKLKRILFDDYQHSTDIKDKIEIILEYQGVLKDEDMPWGIDKVSEHWVELSSNSMWMPIIESFDTHVIVSATVTLESTKDMKVISSGEVARESKNNFIVNNHIPQIDFVIIGSPEVHVVSSDKMVLFTKQEPKKLHKDFLERSEQSLYWLNDHFGNVKQLEHGKLVIAPRTESGYARKNFIILTDIQHESEEFLTEFITHEFVHFWSSKTNPRTRHRWLDESIAQYLALVYFKEVYGNEKHEVILKKYRKEAATLPPVYDESRTGAPPHAVMYRKGVAKLDWLEQHIGQQTVIEILNTWFASEGRETEDFLVIVEGATNKRIANAFRKELAK